MPDSPGAMNFSRAMAGAGVTISNSARVAVLFFTAKDSSPALPVAVAGSQPVSVIVKASGVAFLASSLPQATRPTASRATPHTADRLRLDIQYSSSSVVAGRGDPSTMFIRLS